MTANQFRKMTEEEIRNSDPMVVERCAGSTQLGARCRNHSAWLPRTLLVDARGYWYCHLHHHLFTPIPEAEEPR